MQSKILASAHLKVLVNGRLLGWTSGFSPRVRTSVRPAMGIDNSTAIELIPTSYSVSGTMEVYRGRLQGGLEGLGMVAFAKDLLRQKYCTIEVVDRATDTTVFKIIGCTVTEQAWRVSPKALVSGTIQFEGLETSNEADL
jgi:hypothetical protein